MIGAHRGAVELGRFSTDPERGATLLTAGCGTQAKKAPSHQSRELALASRMEDGVGCKRSHRQSRRRSMDVATLDRRRPDPGSRVRPPS